MTIVCQKTNSNKLNVKQCIKAKAILLKRLQSLSWTIALVISIAMKDALIVELMSVLMLVLLILQPKPVSSHKLVALLVQVCDFYSYDYWSLIYLKNRAVCARILGRIWRDNVEHKQMGGNVKRSIGTKWSVMGQNLSNIYSSHQFRYPP